MSEKEGALHVFTKEEIAELIPIAEASEQDSRVIPIEEGLLAGQSLFVVKGGKLISDYEHGEDGLILGGQAVWIRTSEVYSEQRPRFGFQCCLVKLYIDLSE